VPDVSYPNFTGKHAGEALYTAADFVAYLRRVGLRGDEPTPAGVILCYQPSLYDHVLRAEGLAGKTPRGLPVALPSTGGRVGLLGKFGIGAPAAAVELEQLAALAVRGDGSRGAVRGGAGAGAGAGVGLRDQRFFGRGGLETGVW
jgi:uridine phosphorylase